MQRSGRDELGITGGDREVAPRRWVEPMAEDKIILSGMVFYGYHGVNRAERELGQLSDDLAMTVNYASVFSVVKDVVEGQPSNLIEAVAERLATAILARFPVESVRVRVRKPWAPVSGSVLDWVGVEIVRARATGDPR